MSISEIRQKAERRYLCERCGGTGQQPEGSYSVKARSYCEKAGKCSSCNGEGLLGYLPIDHESVVTLLDLIDRMKKALLVLASELREINEGCLPDGDGVDVSTCLWAESRLPDIEAILKELEEGK